MKKLLLVLFTVTAIAATSCKKDSETAPLDKTRITQDKKNIGTWD